MAFANNQATASTCAHGESQMKIHALWSLPLLPLRDGWFFGLVYAENYARGGGSFLLGKFKRGW
jgi:hypothetical protein